MLTAFLEYSFLKNALFAAVLASVLCGVVGVIVTEKKMLMLSGGIAHTAYGGVGLGYLLGIEPIFCAAIFSVGAAITIGSLRRKNGVNTDIIISLLWSFGMALGIAFTGLMKGYPPDMTFYLFGNILSVTKSDLNIILPLTVIVLVVTVVFFNDWKAYLFDSRFAKVSGIKTAVLENVLLILIALSIISMIYVVGIILVIALLSAPAACAAQLVKTLKSRMFTAGAFCFVFCFIGLAISYYFGISSGAAIVFIAVTTYFLILLAKKVVSNRTN